MTEGRAMPDRTVERLISLDVFRGGTVALMILVNNAGDGHVSYAQLRHSVWNGCTLTDLVFPNFLFIAGASIALAFGNRLASGVKRGSILLQVIRRSALICALGLFLNALPDFHLGQLRYCGVLQRIALCYLLASIVYLAGGVAASVGVGVLTIAGYWMLMTRVLVPGFGIPGAGIAVLDRMGNLASWLDRALIPTAHLYRHSFYDPEGLLSTLPALGTTLLGVIAGSWLASRAPATRKAWALLFTGIVFAACGLLWGHSFPLNKRLWTSSYVLFAGGISLSLLGGLFWLIDGPIRLRRGLAPWLILGTNALTAYMLSELLAIALAAIRLPSGLTVQKFLFQLLPASLGSPSFLSAVYSVLFVLVCTLPVAMLYRRKIFLKL